MALAGDIACDPANKNFKAQVGVAGACDQKYTSDQIVNHVPAVSAVAALGDIQYYCSSTAALLGSYDPTWGRFKSITYSAQGNHELLTNGGSDPLHTTGCDATNTDGAGYRAYWAGTPSAGVTGKYYYSYNVGSWHIVVLNSNCTPVGGCGSTSPQIKWLKADLLANPTSCTLAYAHIPLFSSDTSGGRAASNMKAAWDVLVANHAELFFFGHSHNFEAFYPQTSAGVRDDVNGLTEFISGTGGSDHTAVSQIPVANTISLDTKTFGVSFLTMHPTGWDLSFEPAVFKGNGTYSYKQSGTCH